MDSQSEPDASRTACEASVELPGRIFVFAAAHPDDHLIDIIRRTKNFYEADVLAKIAERLASRGMPSGAAIDVGAYLGNHTTYFATVLRLNPVLAIEANPESFRLLCQNVERNRLSDVVLLKNVAIGCREGTCYVSLASTSNRGASTVTDVGAGKAVRLTTLDREASAVGPQQVVVLKIDVEGGEHDVLRGAKAVLATYSPLICIEAHTGPRFLMILRTLNRQRYVVIDCLGYSPTYIIEKLPVSRLLRVAANAIWIVRGFLPVSWSTPRWFMKRVAQRVAGVG